MTWTKTLPTQVGWYWWRKREGSEAVMVLIEYNNRLPGLHLYALATDQPVAELEGKCEWSGPISEPVENRSPQLQRRVQELEAYRERVLQAVQSRIQSLSYRSGDESAGACRAELESLLREIESQSETTTEETSKMPRPKLDELLSQITDDNLHPEADWGPPVGKEVID